MKVNNQTFLHTTLFLVIVYFGFLILSTTPDYNLAAYSQNQSSSFQAEVNAIDNMSAQRVKVGDIDMAYKKLGNESSDIPIILIAGGGTTMDMWSPTLLKDLSSNQTVIIFDNRGAGESTMGTRGFSISQFANDTAGLLDALKIDKADVFGHSMGSFIAQELALMSPERINSLVLSGSSCGGRDAIPPSREVMKVMETIAGSINSSSPVREESFVSLLFPSNWLKANPDYQNYMPIPEESVSSQVLQGQIEAILNWDGTCTDLAKITQPTLVVVGTEDIFAPAANSLMIVDKIPSAWLVQVRNAGHGLMNQYPDKFNMIVSTFLQTNS
jgi:pimeloyl-ACP methyl ester carboxylesterase